MNVLVTGELHQDAWAPLLRDADEYTKSQRCVAGEDLAEWIVFHVEDLKADAHNKAGTPAAGMSLMYACYNVHSMLFLLTHLLSCIAGERQQQRDRHQFPVVKWMESSVISPTASLSGRRGQAVIMRLDMLRYYTKL